MQRKTLADFNSFSKSESDWLTTESSSALIDFVLALKALAFDKSEIFLSSFLPVMVSVLLFQVTLLSFQCSFSSLSAPLFFSCS